MRSASTSYTSNGRDYLASELGCTREQLDTWLKSSKVRPHLQVWYKLCVLGLRRCKEVVEWVETGTHIGHVGYFYDPVEFQLDVALMCLGEGNVEGGPNYSVSQYADPTVQTYDWSTQEVWARTVWRIVQENGDGGDFFEAMIQEHPAKAYALVIDMLSIAFHSIIFRRCESVWEKLIGFGVGLPFEALEDEAAEFTRNKMVIYLANQLDQSPNAEPQKDDVSDALSEADSEVDIIDHVDDEEFADPVTPNTKATNSESSPRAPRKRKWRDVVEEEDEIVVMARSVHKWLRDKSATPTPIRQQLVSIDSV